MFGKKVKKPVDEPGGVNVRENTFGKKRKSNLLENGVPKLHDLMCPPSFDRSQPDRIQVGAKFVRNFLVAGYPKQIPVGWANHIFDYDGDLDLAIHVNPVDERIALDELTMKITQFHFP